MKIKQLAKSMLLPLVVLGTVFNSNLSGQAQSRGDASFFCGNHDGKLATVARHSTRGDIAFIVWTSDYFSGSGYTPNVRCQEVSDRFNRNQRSGMLNYIIPSELNGLPVVCASRTESNTDCSNQTLLFTLRHYDDPNRIIYTIARKNLGISEEYVPQGTVLRRNRKNGNLLLVVEEMYRISPRTRSRSTPSRSTPSRSTPSRSTPSRSTPPRSTGGSTCAFGPC